MSSLKEFQLTNQWLFEAAKEAGLCPQPLDAALFKVQRSPDSPPLYLGKGHLPLNSASATSLARDKYSCRLVLESQKLPNIPFWRPDKTSWSVFWQKYAPLVAKPVYGSQSQGIVLLEKETNRQKLNSDLYYIYEQFIQGVEWRVLVFYNQVLAVHQKHYNNKINIQGQNHRVSLPKEKWPSQLIDVALQAANALQLNYGAVDFLWPEDQKPLILEINADPGLYKLRYPDEGPGLNLVPTLIEKIKTSCL